MDSLIASSERSTNAPASPSFGPSTTQTIRATLSPSSASWTHRLTMDSAACRCRASGGLATQGRVCDRCVVATSSAVGVGVGVGAGAAVGIGIGVATGSGVGAAVGVAPGAGVGCGEAVGTGVAATGVGVGVERTATWTTPTVGGAESQAASASTRDTATARSGNGREGTCIPPCTIRDRSDHWKHACASSHAPC